jgi:hypothetical protein
MVSPYRNVRASCVPDHAAELRFRPGKAAIASKSCDQLADVPDDQ